LDTKWNADGYEGLKDKETRTGRPPKLDKEKMIKGLTGDNLRSFQRQCLELSCVRWRFSCDAGEKLDTLSPVHSSSVKSRITYTKIILYI